MKYKSFTLEEWHDIYGFLSIFYYYTYPFLPNLWSNFPEDLESKYGYFMPRMGEFFYKKGDFDLFGMLGRMLYCSFFI